MNDEILTLSEINERFACQWVLVVDPELTPANEVIRGRVMFHSKNRDEVDEKAVELQPGRAAMLYTGPWPEGLEVVL